MLIDLTRYPLVILPDECRSSVIIRTRTTRAVNGIVVGEDPYVRGSIKGKKLKPIPETASSNYGGDTYHETRLPLVRDERLQAEAEAGNIALIYEAASAAKDSLTDTAMIWRVQISVMRKSTGLWSIALYDMVKEVALATIATKTLAAVGVWEESVPLARAAKSKLVAAEPTFWDRIAEDD